MGARIGSLLLCLLILISGCSKPTAPGGGSVPSDPPAPGTTGTPSTPGSGSTGPAARPNVDPVVVKPRLILDLPLGDDLDQPGRLAGRAGGISPSGPFALAAEWGALYLVDAAKSRILQYDLQGRLVGTIPTPWMDNQVAGLTVGPFGPIVTLPLFQYTIGRDGRFLEISHRSTDSRNAVDQGKGPQPIGKDGAGNRYERAMGDHGLVARRVSGDGNQLAVAPLEAVGVIRDWYISRDGGLYALSYEWGQGEIARARVYEVLPQVNFSSPPGGFDPSPSPVVIGHQLPTRIRLTFADWAPVEVTAEADRWNIWQLLTTVAPAESPEPGADYWGFGIEATLPDGSILPMQVQHDQLRLGGKRYKIPFFEGLIGVVHHLRFSEEALKNALTVASSVRVAILDLPGVERDLTVPERERLHQSLTGAIPVISAAGPQTLDSPFPRYGIHLEGKDWKGTLVLSADRYIQTGFGGSVLHKGELARLVKDSLPVPQLKLSDVGYLYLADRLEIGQGNDLTRRKNTVVRSLVNARVLPGRRPSTEEPFNLTFWVKGERLVVQVDADGFTYAGKRYPGSALTEMVRLQGVP